MLDLQRDAIDSLHERIRRLECDKRLIAVTLHTTYYSILSAVQVRYIYRNLHFQTDLDRGPCTFPIKKVFNENEQALYFLRRIERYRDNVTNNIKIKFVKY